MSMPSKDSETAKPEEESVTVHICGNGVAYVDSEELIRSKKVQGQLVGFGKLFRAQRRRQQGA